MSNSEKILNDIKELQKLEQQMFSELEQNGTLSNQDKSKMSATINQLADMRSNLYKNIDALSKTEDKNYSSAYQTLKGQLSAIEVVEKQLAESRKELDGLEIEKNNKIRMVQINDYYGDKYEEHADFMKLVIVVLLPIIVLTLLLKKKIISSTLYYALVVLIAGIGAYFGWSLYFSIINRNNMNYQTYNWQFDPSYAPTAKDSKDSSGNDTSGNDPWVQSNNSNECYGDECCADGTQWDCNTNQCVIGSGSREGFLTQEGISTMMNKSKNQNKYKQMNDSNFQPNNAEGFINYKA
jgi:hypothetical protein